MRKQPAPRSACSPCAASRADGTFATSAGPLTVTVSVGAALAQANAAGPGELIKQADEALYAAKRGGRNCVAAMVNDTPVVFNQRSRTAA